MSELITVLVVVAAIVLLVASIHLVIGWFVSNGLYHGALAVGPREKDLGVRVREVSRNRIVLEAPGPRQDIGHPGTLGLSWDGGYGRLGDVIDVDDGRFIRKYQPVDGLPPVCVRRLEDCEPVEIDSFAYPGDPGGVGLNFRATTYETSLGPMGAWLVPAAGRRWAIHCHGWTAEKRELIRMLPTYHRAGLNSMVIDYRNDDGAPPDPSGRYRFGLTEWEDLEAAVATAVEMGAHDLVLTGCSTGAALVMRFLERSELSSRVGAVVLDSPNIILAEAFRHGTRDARATRLMIEFGMWIADLRWNIDWTTTNFVERAEMILTMPTLVFHGTSDQVIPIEVSRRLAARVPETVQLIETPAAGHVMSWNADPAGYDRRLREFLERV